MNPNPIPDTLIVNEDERREHERSIIPMYSDPNILNIPGPIFITNQTTPYVQSLILEDEEQENPTPQTITIIEEKE